MVGDSAERRVEILCERDELHVTWTRFGPGRDGAGLHVHRRHSDLFYVLAGELTLRLGPQDERRVLLPGTLVHVPPLVVHGFRNEGDAELRYLNVHAPGTGFADYLRGRNPGFDQHEPPADGGGPVESVLVVPPGTTGVLVERDGLRVERRAEAGPAPARPTLHHALEDGRLLELRV